MTFIIKIVQRLLSLINLTYQAMNMLKSSMCFGLKQNLCKCQQQLCGYAAACSAPRTSSIRIRDTVHDYLCGVFLHRLNQILACVFACFSVVVSQNLFACLLNKQHLKWLPAPFARWFLFHLIVFFIISLVVLSMSYFVVIIESIFSINEGMLKPVFEEIDTIWCMSG